MSVADRTCALRSLLRVTALGAVSLLIPGAHGVAQNAYFPAGSFDSNQAADQFMARWFSGQLKAMQEPSLLSAAMDHSAEAFRFFWLRSFHHPVAVRVDVRADGSATVTTKVADGAGGYQPGKLITNETRTLAKPETEKLLSTIRSLDFWSLPTPEPKTAELDGAEWSIEGVSHGRYHIVTRWSPQHGPIRSLGRVFLFDLARLRIPKSEIY